MNERENVGVNATPPGAGVSDRQQVVVGALLTSAAMRGLQRAQQRLATVQAARDRQTYFADPTGASPELKARVWTPETVARFVATLTAQKTARPRCDARRDIQPRRGRR